MRLFSTANHWIKFPHIQDTYALTLLFLGQDIKTCGLLPLSPHTRYLRPHSSTSWTRYQEMWSTANFTAYKILTPSLFNFLDKISRNVVYYQFPRIQDTYALTLQLLVDKVSRNVVYCQFPRVQDTYALTLQFLGQDIKTCGLLPISPHTRYLRPHSSTSWTRYQEMWSTVNFPAYKILTPSLFSFLDKISRNVVYCQFHRIQDTYALTLQFLGKISRNVVYCQFHHIQDTYALTLQLLVDKVSRNVVYCQFPRVQDTYALTLQFPGQDIKTCGLLPISPHIRYLLPHFSISWTRYQDMWSTTNFPAYKILTPSLFNFLEKISRNEVTRNEVTANFPAYKILKPSLFNVLDKISRNVVYCQFPRIQDTYTLTLQFLGQDIKKCGLLPISPHTRYLRPHSSTSWTRYQDMWSTANFPAYKILTPSLFNFLDKISRNVVSAYKILTLSLFNFLDKISRNVFYCTYTLTLQFLGQYIKKCGLPLFRLRHHSLDGATLRGGT